MTTQKDYCFLVLKDIDVYFAKPESARDFLRGFKRALQCDFMEPHEALAPYEARGFSFCHKLRFFCRQHGIDEVGLYDAQVFDRHYYERRMSAKRRGVVPWIYKTTNGALSS